MAGDMRRVGTKELRADLRNILLAVRRGQTVIVTSYNRDVAALVPFGDKGRGGRKLKDEVAQHAEAQVRHLRLVEGQRDEAVAQAEALKAAMAELQRKVDQLTDERDDANARADLYSTGRRPRGFGRRSA